MTIISTFWKHYRACSQALRKWIIGKTNNYLAGPSRHCTLLADNSNSYCWRGVAYTVIGLKFVAFSTTHVHCTNGQSWNERCTVLIFSEQIYCMLLMVHACMLVTLSHDCDIKYTIEWQSLFTGLDYWNWILDSKRVHMKLNLACYSLVGQLKCCVESGLL